jgi:hypothetical protein
VISGFQILEDTQVFRGRFTDINERVSRSFICTFKLHSENIQAV